MKTDESDTSGMDIEATSVAEVVAEEGDFTPRLRPADHVDVVASEGNGLVEPATMVAAPAETVEVEILVVAEEEVAPGPSRHASADVLPADRPRRFRLPLPRFGRKAAIGLAAILVLAFSGVAYATYNYDRDYDSKLLPGIVIADVDVGGMTRDEAFRAVKASSKIQLDRTFTVRYTDKKWLVTPRELGAHSNAGALVDAAVAESEGAGLVRKAGLAVFGGRLDFERDLAITYPRQGVKGFIEGVASTLDREPIDAGVEYESGWLEFVQPQEGRRVLKGKSRAALLAALRNESDRVVLPVRATEPEVTEHKWEKVLLLRIGENKLYLYQDGEITHEYVVATGLPEYPTPTGEYYITEKRYLPTWINPDPEGWGAGMPLSIGPGPGNPLGTRALNWSASGIRFHGTEATYSLGSNASHGCVRMAMSDVEELYELVDVGTPIVSLVASSLDPMYESSPDPGPPVGTAN